MEASDGRDQVMDDWMYGCSPLRWVTCTEVWLEKLFGVNHGRELRKDTEYTKHIHTQYKLQSFPEPVQATAGYSCCR